MLLEVVTQVLDSNGEAIWGFCRREVVVARALDTDEEVKEAMLDLGQKLLDTIDEAKASIGSQIASEAANADR